jgi:NAD(P)-dependent dehydrogenase (short-subunit alcohol dehydrogenase family)
VGAAIAEALAGAGCNLILHGLNEDQFAADTIARCEEKGIQVQAVYTDLAEPTEECVNRLIKQADAISSDVSLLVNNAGTYCDEPFLQMSYATFEKTMRLNVHAGFFLTQAYARRWVERQIRGRVLFTGSINGELAEADHAAYDTSKGAVRMMVRSLCVALAPHGIRVNAMAPGLVVTPLTAPVLNKDPEALRWMQLHTPNGCVPGPDVCGPAALFLMSDEAEHIHGQTLLVDGGMSTWQQPEFPEEFRKRKRHSD